MLFLLESTCESKENPKQKVLLCHVVTQCTDGRAANAKLANVKMNCKQHCNWQAHQESNRSLQFSQRKSSCRTLCLNCCGCRSLSSSFLHLFLSPCPFLCCLVHWHFLSMLLSPVAVILLLLLQARKHLMLSPLLGAAADAAGVAAGDDKGNDFVVVVHGCCWQWCGSWSCFQHCCWQQQQQQWLFFLLWLAGMVTGCIVDVGGSSHPAEQGFWQSHKDLTVAALSCSCALVVAVAFTIISVALLVQSQWHALSPSKQHWNFLLCASALLLLPWSFLWGRWFNDNIVVIKTALEIFVVSMWHHTSQALSSPGAAWHWWCTSAHQHNFCGASFFFLSVEKRLHSLRSCNFLAKNPGEC